MAVDTSRQRIYDFLNLYYKLFVDTKIETGTFKLHHLIHYPDLELIFGPFFYLATWRYERFHQQMMQLVSQSKNMTNLEFSMAKSFAQTFKLNRGSVLEITIVMRNTDQYHSSVKNLSTNLNTNLNIQNIL